MRILFSLSRLHHEKNNVLAEIFLNIGPKLGNGLRESTNHPGHFPSSTYLESIGWGVELKWERITYEKCTATGRPFVTFQQVQRE